MPKRSSTIRPAILQHAIVCFGDRGCDGVTTRELAAAAGVTEGSVYRLFKSKENLYEESIHTAVKRAREAISGTPGTVDSGSPAGCRRQLADTLRGWFEGLLRADARTLHQVLKRVTPADRKLREQAYEPIAEITKVVSGILESNGKTPTLDSPAASCNAEIVVMALFQHKTFQAEAHPSEAESQKINTLVENWVDLVAPMNDHQDN